MSTQRHGIELEIRGSGTPVRLSLPVGVFSPPAEQLRWDAFRLGHLRAADWSRVCVQVDPVCPPGQESDAEFAFAVTLLGPAKPVRRVYRPGQLQQVQMLLTSKLGFGEQPLSVAVYWNRLHPIPVPLAPMTIPVTDEAGWRPRRELSPVWLMVSDDVLGFLAAISDRSLTRGAELGGALLGRFRDPDELVIESAVAAADDGGSAGGFRFDSRFWAGLAKIGGRRSRRIVGWFHSHLCDQGHPSTLSELDLRIMHRHFAAPWLVTALVCASAHQPEARWYQWQDGAVVEHSVFDRASRKQETFDRGKT